MQHILTSAIVPPANKSLVHHLAPGPVSRKAALLGAAQRRNIESASSQQDHCAFSAAEHSPSSTTAIQTRRMLRRARSWRERRGYRTWMYISLWSRSRCGMIYRRTGCRDGKSLMMSSTRSFVPTGQLRKGSLLGNLWMLHQYNFPTLSVKYYGPHLPRELFDVISRHW